MNNKYISRLLVFMLVMMILSSVFGVSTMGNSFESKDFESDENVKPISNNIYNFLPTSDLKIRVEGGSWEDNHLDVEVNDVVEFKITLDSLIYDYNAVLVSIFLPIIDDNILKPMFNYIEGSANPLPSDEEGSFYGSNIGVVWSWKVTGDNWQKDLTFKAKAVREGEDSIDLQATWIIDAENYDDVEDCVEIKITSCCFPAGTKITMADGSYKNIENVKVGEKVLSYNVENDKFTSWSVKMLGNPVHPVYEINNGLVCATVDHPFYVKKTDGREGWAAYDAERAKNAITFKGDVLTMEIGDQLYSSNGELIEITDINFDSEPVQTYNLLSFSGTKTYFANGILVYEEHPPHCMTDYFLRLLGEKFPRLEQLLLSNPFFNKLLRVLP